MIAVTSLLVLAVAVLLPCNAQLSEVCTKTSYGYKTPVAVKLARVYLGPKVNWEVAITPVPECPHVVGAVAIVCDDVAAGTNFVDNTLLIVKRNGELQKDATVDITLYCAENQVWNKENNPVSVKAVVNPATLWDQNYVSNHKSMNLWDQNYVSNHKPLNLWDQTSLPISSQKPLNLWEQKPLKLWDHKPSNVWDKKRHTVIAQPQ